MVISTTTPCYLTDGAGDPSSASGGDADADSVEMDSYAIIPACTLFSHIVPTVLRKLGYGDDSIFNATGQNLFVKNAILKFRMGFLSIFVEILFLVERCLPL